MINERECHWAGCDARAGPHHFIHGCAYCPDHYDQALERHFFEVFENWDGDSEPSRKFLNLFSRYAESLYENGIPSGLTKGRLNHRSYKFQKQQTSLTFCIDRHPYAWTESVPTGLVTQQWRFDIEEKTLTLIEEKCP